MTFPSYNNIIITIIIIIIIIGVGGRHGFSGVVGMV